MPSDNLKIFVSKAKENLKAAELLFENQLYDALQAKFSGELIRKRKIFPNRFRTFLMDLQSKRLQADYNPQSLSKKVAERQLKKAIEFVNAIHKEIKCLYKNYLA